MRLVSEQNWENHICLKHCNPVLPLRNSSSGILWSHSTMHVPMSTSRFRLLFICSLLYLGSCYLVGEAASTSLSLDSDHRSHV